MKRKPSRKRCAGCWTAPKKRGSTDLKQTIEDLQKSEKSLKEQTRILYRILEKAAEGICVCHNIPEAPGVRFSHWNPRMTDITGYTFDEINRLGWDQTLYPDPELRIKAVERMDTMRRGHDLHSEEWEIRAKDGSVKTLAMSTSVLQEEDGKVHVLAVMRDVSEQKRYEAQLHEARETLEQRVRERTGELETQKKQLQEVNTALNVMLAKRDDDKRMIEENVLFNIKAFIEPLIADLKKSRLSERQAADVDTLEIFLQNIVSPFSRSLRKKYLGLTLSEVRVANLIKEGRTTKEIAALLQSTPRAVDFHRQNIRKKLGLRNRKVHLASYLLSILE